MPATRNSQFSVKETPDETTPHIKAHIGGNQVIGFDSSTTSRKRGKREGVREMAESAPGVVISQGYVKLTIVSN
jgi:hypothetical protein